jgi:5-methylcytosine-specific restriction endonuclease McrA
VAPDPKPRRRVVDASAGAAKVAAEGECRACRSTRRGEAWWYRLQRHHLVPRSLGGDDVDDNIIPLCPPCHTDYEGNGKERRGIARRIRAKLQATEEAYILAKKSEAWLRRYYAE